jgi:hypothetical protein
MSTDVSEVRAASIIRAMIMEAVRTSEISKKERSHNKFRLFFTVKQFV